MATRIVASYCTTFLKAEMLHIYRQITGLQRYKTVVLTLHREQADRYPFEPVVEIPRARIHPVRRFYLKYIDRKPPIVYRGEYDVLRGLLERFGAELMHIYFGHTGVHLLPFVETWPGRCVVSFHGMDVRERAEEPGYRQRLERLLQVVPLVLARSESLGRCLQDLGCPAEKIRISRTGIPLDAFPFSPRHQPENGAWHLVQACRLIEKKGVPITLQAFSQFQKRYPNARLSIIGEGPLLPQLEDLALELGIRDKVEFTGFVEQKELARQFAQAHLFVHPSHKGRGNDQEGVPNALLEAMATGLPAVATWHGGIPEAVADGDSGLLVPEFDVEATAAAMLKVAEAPALAERLGRSGADAVRCEFERSAQIARLEHFYDEATS